MNIENCIYNSKKALDLCRNKIESREYDTALALATSAYSDIRWLVEHVFELKRTASAAARPAGETVGGP